MNSIKEINQTLDYLDSTNLDPEYKMVIEHLRKRLYRLTLFEERMITRNFSFIMFIDILPFIAHSLKFFKKNTINLPSKFKEDLILKYINNYDQIVSSNEDIFVNQRDSLNISDISHAL